MSSTSSNRSGAAGSAGAAGAGPLLLYDGTCGFCAASVQFILRHEREHTLRFAPLDSELGRSLRLRHPDLAGVDSMIWIESEGARPLVRSAAGLRVTRYLGGVWRLTAPAYLIPGTIRDSIYDLIARHRHRLVRDPAQCYVPPPAVRERFLGSESVQSRLRTGSE